MEGRTYEYSEWIDDESTDECGNELKQEALAQQGQAG